MTQCMERFVDAELQKHGGVVSPGYSGVPYILGAASPFVTPELHSNLVFF